MNTAMHPASSSVARLVTAMDALTMSVSRTIEAIQEHSHDRIEQGLWEQQELLKSLRIALGERTRGRSCNSERERLITAARHMYRINQRYCALITQMTQTTALLQSLRNGRETADVRPTALRCEA
jgi:hypothetical protein